MLSQLVDEKTARTVALGESNWRSIKPPQVPQRTPTGLCKANGIICTNGHQRCSRFGRVGKKFPEPRRQSAVLSHLNIVWTHEECKIGG